MRAHIEPFLQRLLRLDPALLAATPQQAGVLPAIVVLTIMIDPDHLVDLPRALRRASRATSRRRRSGSARRAGRWCAASSSRTCKGGVVAAVTLGLGRALGEAIAVTQVIGNSLQPFRISLFATGNTLASQLASSYQSAPTNIEVDVARLPRR